jgi:hypothetical protein
VSSLEGPLDPNATLEEIRSLIRRGRFQDLAPTDSHHLVELIEALDTWLAGGGFLPARWLSWWWVRPSELAARYGFDADKLRDNVNPEDLNDRQFDLVMAALRLCDERTGQMTVPGE